MSLLTTSPIGELSRRLGDKAQPLPDLHFARGLCRSF